MVKVTLHEYAGSQSVKVFIGFMSCRIKTQKAVEEAGLFFFPSNGDCLRFPEKSDADKMKRMRSLS
jgi:hypothetical protein